MIPPRDADAASLRATVVIPVKDDARELAACLAALAAQSRPADEVVVVDNASTDDSASVARAAGASVVRCDVPGIPAAASHGYDSASGDVILRLDADCRPDVDWIARMLRSLEDSPDVAAVSAGAAFIDGPRLLRRPLEALYLGSYVVLTAAALGHPPVFGSNLAMRREAWAAVSAHVHRDDPEIHDDLDLAFHLGERHRVRWLRSRGMGMSMRPFGPGRGFGRRVARGLRTVTVHWPSEFPPHRWARRAANRSASVGAQRRRAATRAGSREAG
jgi:glycosyltransferase involved in cell wall biosynthesis